MSRRFKKISLQMSSFEEVQLITAAAESDPQALALTVDQMTTIVPMQVLGGCPKLANKKQLVSIWYRPEVINYFRVSGAGW